MDGRARAATWELVGLIFAVPFVPVSMVVSLARPLHSTDRRPGDARYG